MHAAHGNHSLITLDALPGIRLYNDVNVFFTGDDQPQLMIL